MSNPFRRICIAACDPIAAVGLIAADAAAQARGGAPTAPARRPFAKPGTPPQARAAPVRRRPAHQGRADARRQEARGPRHRDPHGPPAPPVPQDRSSWTAARTSRSKQVTVGPDKAACTFTPQRRHPDDRPGQAPRARRDVRAGHRVRRLPRPRHPLHPPRPGLSREADGHLDPGRGRGHAPLAPLLRLPQRPRHHRDDRHGREAAVRPLQRRAGRHPGRGRATPRPTTGRWMSPSSAT